ncbi:MAG: hypothetical protein AB7K24_22810 [Gemmataceae bacterium]
MPGRFVCCAMLAALLLGRACSTRVEACRPGWGRRVSFVRCPCPPIHEGTTVVHEPRKELDYFTQFKDVVDRSRWCVVSSSAGRFIVRTDKLRKPFDDLLDQARQDFKGSRPKTQKEVGGPPWEPEFWVDLYDNDGERVGYFGFPDFNRKTWPMIYFNGGYLPLASKSAMNFKKDIQPPLCDFANNCEALTSSDSGLIGCSLDSIVQAAFRDHAKDAIRLMEPLLESSDPDVMYYAAEALLKLSPAHKEAQRVYRQRKLSPD